MRKFRLLLLACMISLTNNSYATIDSKLPGIVVDQWKSAEKVGETTFNKFGLHIYDASFWSLRNDQSLQQPTNATALSISYARNIKAKRLLSSTYKEWQRLGFARQHPLDAWLTSLEKLWPDVQKGDYLVFVSSPNGSNTFYSGNKLLGSVNDPAFASAFLDIWLSIDARHQKHRKELLGESN